jgi:hypothetical protein
VSAEYLKINKLGKVPTFVGADGYTLNECIAIAIYSMFNKVTATHLPLRSLLIWCCYDEKKSKQLSLS